MSIILSGVSFNYRNQQLLFKDINLSVVSGKKVSFIGDNGTGKSTLLKLIAGELTPFSGNIKSASKPYYIPQQIGITGKTISESLNVSEKIEALYAIYGGSEKQIYYDTLGDDWDIESRCRAALDYWELSNLDLTTPIDTMSGGEKTKLFLSGIMIHKPEIILLDEPTNHLDYSSRRKLYDFITNSNSTIIVVSHDITLLNLLDTTYELSSKGLKLYGGNYDFYREQKDIEDSALEQQINTEQTTLRQARKKAQEIKERQEKRSIQGDKNKETIPRIMWQNLKNRGENTLSKLKDKHSDIIDRSSEKLYNLRQKKQTICELKINFEDAKLHNGKLLTAAKEVNFGYNNKQLLWKSVLNIEIRSGERVHITGNNGSGKTTLIKLLTGELEPTLGEIIKTDFSYIYLDQEYSKINTSKSVLELAEEHNTQNIQEHEVKLRLHRALFPKETWDKSCNTLSGGERMRLYLCCLMISNNVPDMFILDEPTNNLDISSLTILTNTIKNYNGTLLVISHDINFTKEIELTKTINLQSVLNRL